MKKLLTITAIAIAFTSCETDVTDKVRTDVYNNSSSLSISGAITNIDTLGTYVDLKLSNPYLDNGALQGIEGASIQLFDGDSLLGALTETVNGRYEEVNFQSTPGHFYRVEVVIPEAYGTLSGIWESTLDECKAPFTQIRPMFSILEGDSLYYDYRVDDTVFYADADSAFYSPYQFWNDPVGVGNGYWVKSYATTKIYAPNGLLGPLEPQETEVSLASSIVIFNDEEFIEGPQISRFNFIGRPYTVYTDTLIDIVYEIRTISPPLFDFLNIMSANVNNGGLFSVPYSPQIGNIRRLDDTTVFGLGYFYATSVRFDSVTMYHPY